MRRAALLFIIMSIMFARGLYAQNGGSDETQFRRFEIAWDVLSYARQGELDTYGGDLSFTTNINKRVGITADVAVHIPSDFTSATITQYRFGPKFYGFRVGRIQTFGEVLAGGSHISDGFGGTDSGLSLAVGGGLDLRIKQWISWRAFQYDYSYIRMDGGNSNGFRAATGVVFRFGDK